MFTLKSPLKYFPIKKGDYELSYIKDSDEFILREKNYSWMGYDQKSFWQSSEFYIELYRAQGVCITTGLGLGILQSLLCLKKDVTKVIVYEKSNDVIEIFNEIVDYNNFDISKMEIRNGNADDISGQVCDCLFPDHFSAEPEDHVINIVKNLSLNNTTNLVWYWPAGLHFIKFAISKDLSLTNETYEQWKSYTQIKNLPVSLDEICLNYISELKNIYKKDVSTSYGRDIEQLELIKDQRKKLLEQSKKYKNQSQN